MSGEDGRPVRVSSWDIEADALVERKAKKHPVAEEATEDGRTYAVDAQPARRRQIHISPRDPAAYLKAVDTLHKHGFGVPSEELAGLKRAVERHLDPDDPASNVVLGPVRRQKKLSVPGRFKPDYRAFEKWLVEGVERNDFVPDNFGFWCAAKIDAGHVDLDRLGFSKDMITRVKAAIAPDAAREPMFGPVQFLAVVSEIHVDRLENALEFLRLEPGGQEIERQQARGAYLANDELDRCIDACRSWRIYDEPGAEVAAEIVGALFKEMNRRGISKAELAERAGVSEKTLDTWNHAEAEKRTPPQLPKIAACLEAIGLRLMVVPEADIVRLGKKR